MSLGVFHRLNGSIVLALLLATGCTRGSGDRVVGARDGGSDLGDGSVGTGDIRIEPGDHTAAIEGAPVVIDYRAFVGDREVTSEVTWSLTVPSLGSFTGSQFVSGVERGGRTGVIAQLGALRGTAFLTLRVTRVVIAEGAPDDAPTRFGGTADPAVAPELVYPSDGVVVPPNMREMEFHYRPSGSSVFELSFQAPALDLRVYVGCPESVGGGCIYTPDDDVWDTIATAARGAGPIPYTLRGSDGTRVGTAAEQHITFAEEDITGGLYYWNAGGGRIMRYEWGRRGVAAEVYLDTGRTGALTCVGCHSVSRDGTRIAVGLDIPGSTFQSYDVATRERIFSRGGGGGAFPFPGGGGISEPSFFTFSPDTSQIVSGSGRGLDIRDAATGEVVVPGVAPNATMPDWSPDGSHIVYVESATPPPFDTPGVSSGSIATLELAGSTWQRGPMLVTRTSENNYYPAYSPDGGWVVFNRSPSNTGSMGDDEEGMVARVSDAELWVVPADGSIAPMRLERADGFADSWPKWDPTPYVDRGRTLFWLSFSSRRGYGLRFEDDARSQLWMAAFYADDARGGLDPASPAIRIPFQELESSNHLPQWVTSIERMTCSTDVECGGEFCVDGRCYPDLI